MNRLTMRRQRQSVSKKELHGGFRGPFAPYGCSKCPADHGKLEINPKRPRWSRRYSPCVCRGWGTQELPSCSTGAADDLKTPNLFKKLICRADCGKAMNRYHL